MLVASGILVQRYIELLFVYINNLSGTHIGTPKSCDSVAEKMQNKYESVIIFVHTIPRSAGGKLH